MIDVWCLQVRGRRAGHRRRRNRCRSFFVEVAVCVGRCVRFEAVVCGGFVSSKNSRQG